MHVARQYPACHAIDQQGNQDRRKRQLDVSNPHDESVQAAADIAGNQPERDTQDHREDDRGKTDEQ